MTPNEEVGLYIFILAGFLGYHVITRVPPLLHTPLMSATNAISGISLIGSIVVVGEVTDPVSTTLGFIAVICSSTNVVGGFLITDRMLKMFKSTKDSTQSGFSRSTLILLGVLAASLLTILFLLEHVRNIPPREILRYLYILSGVL